jgi:hypothetical protein
MPKRDRWSSQTETARTRVAACADLAVIDGNLRSQPQAGATTDNQTLLLSGADLAIRYT